MDADKSYYSTIALLQSCHCEPPFQAKQSPVWRGDCLAALAPLEKAARNDKIAIKQ